MSAPAVTSRVLVVDGDRTHDVFEVVELGDEIVRVRSELLFEIDEELNLRIERDGQVTDTIGRVRAHVGLDAPVTELELYASRETTP